MKKGLLLGAGFSYDFGMPLAYELTDIFLSLFNKNSTKKFLSTISKNDPYGDGRPINLTALKIGVELILKHKKEKSINYENILNELEKLKSITSSTQSDKDSFHYLFSIFYDIIHEILTRYQFESYSILYPKNKKWFESLTNLLSEKETWVFTLNHDIFLECLAIDLSLPITYGNDKSIKFPINNLDLRNQIKFTYINRDDYVDCNNFFMDQFGLNVVKMHGGLGELKYKDGQIICNLDLKKKKSSELMQDFINIDNMCYYANGKKIPSGRSRVITNSSGELDIMEKAMLTGGNKYSSTTNDKKGEEKLKILSEQLKTLEELTIIGYGFADEHINNRILNGMVLNENLKIRIVDPKGFKKPDFLKQFDYDLRIRGAQCSAIQWMDYCHLEKWNTELNNDIKSNNNYRGVIKKRVESHFGINNR